MAQKANRHRLALYTYMLNRWWRATFLIGFVLLVLVAALAWLPPRLPQYTFPAESSLVLLLAGAIGGITVFFSIFLFAIRKSAYVQPFDNHLRLVTPFLRLNISYRRIVQTSTDSIGHLFPLEKYKGRKLDFLRPIAAETAVVLELKGMPMSRPVLELFLSPYFFPDRTSRMALLVPDWIQFSTELESMRSIWRDSVSRTDGDPKSDLLASLSNKKR
jgi:hypothetical protein